MLNRERFKKELDWEWDGITILNSMIKDGFTEKMKCEIRCEGGASQYLKEEHCRQRNDCAKAGLQLMC